MSPRGRVTMSKRRLGLQVFTSCLRSFLISIMALNLTPYSRQNSS